jgi:hypothetical protein
MKTLPAICLTAFAAVVLGAAGLFKEYPIEFLLGHEQTMLLPQSVNPIMHRAELSYLVDLRRLHLDWRAENTFPCSYLRVQFFEDGEPLKNDSMHSHIETQPGLYSHWDHYIVFSPRHGGVPGEESVYSIRYWDLPQSLGWLAKLARARRWYWAAGICMLGLTLGRAIWPSFRCRAASLFLLLGLAGAVSPHVIAHWNSAVWQPDSFGYVHNHHRPPLYPWFIALCKGQEAFAASDAENCGDPVTAPSLALLRVIRAQRLLFWGTFVMAAWAVSLLAPRPLAVWLAFALFQNRMLFPDLETNLLSEVVASALVFFLLVLLCVQLARQSLWPLPAMAAAFGALMLTRSAGVFGIVFLLAAALFAFHQHWRRKLALAGALGSVAAIGFVALGMLLWNGHAQNGTWALSPLKNYERIAFALQCSDPADVEAMTDADARRFLEEGLRNKSELKRREKQDDRLENFDLNLNCWQVAFPLACRMFREQFPLGDPHAESAYIDALFGRVADWCLAHHRGRYFRLVRYSFLELAAKQNTRLNLPHAPFLVLAALAFAGCLFGRGVLGYAGATCILAHVANLIVVSCVELPITRYVTFSEWVCLVGFLFAFLACWRRLFGTMIAGEQNSTHELQTPTKVGFARVPCES